MIFLFLIVLSSISFQVLSMENTMSVEDKKSSASVDLLADPDFKSFIDKFSEHYESISHLPFDEQRKHDVEFICKQNKYEPVQHIENIEILGKENNKISLRIYIPDNSKRLPIMMYFHGGGWVFGGIEESDAVCRRLANHLQCMIVSVGYRLSPEFPFPKPLEDCYTATKWMVINGHTYGGNNQRIIVSGESAGGNLAAAVALMAADKKEFSLSAQVLMYPVISSTIQDDVYDRCPDHYFLTKDAMKFFWDMYVQCPDNMRNPYASLDFRTDFDRLPPAIFITAEYDPLSFDINKYASKLQEAGILVINKSFPKLIHGFLYIPLYKEKDKVEWTKEIGNFLHELDVVFTNEITINSFTTNISK